MGGVAMKKAIHEILERERMSQGSRTSLASRDEFEWENFVKIQIRLYPKMPSQFFWPSMIPDGGASVWKKNRRLTLAPIFEDDSVGVEEWILLQAH
jgi:hypothetical protein